MTLLNMLALAGLVIVLVLAAYALSLWRQVQRKNDDDRAKSREREERLAADIEFLAQSLVNGQVPPIEGAIRIKVLLDNYTGPRREALDLAVFEVVYDATAHIPTHQAWKDLPRATRRQHEETMTEIESTHKPRLEKAAMQLSKGLASTR